MNFSSDPVNNLENLIARNKSKGFSIYLIVLLVVITAIGLLPIIQVDISSQSRGIIRSKKENVPITTVVSGKIEFINLQNNGLVTKGDTLFTISKDNLATELAVNDSLAFSLQKTKEDITNVLLLKTASFKTATIKEAYRNYQAQEKELQSKISQAQTNYNRNKSLYEKGVIAMTDYEQYEYALRFTKQSLASFKSQQLATWENQKKELGDKLKQQESILENLKTTAQNYVIIAPISGTIESFNGLQIGSFISASQPIAIISPNEYLMVECMVKPSDIGLIKKNQHVKFQIDAFNYNQWGLLTGKVIDIDHNITLQENQAFFKVRCSMDSKELKLKSGYKTTVSKGMTLTTQFLITRRSLFDLLFDKVDDWLNPKLIQNTNNL